MELVENALHYRERGWSIIPIEPRSKEAHRDLLKDTEGLPYHWQRWSDTRPDEKTLKYWFETCPDANMAVICGGISGIVVLDIDTPEALAKFSPLLPADLEIPKVKTARGEHWYFGYDVFRRLNGSGEGFDVRGDQTYALLPPSIHESGVAYEWLTPTSPIDLHKMPDALFQALMDAIIEGHNNSAQDDLYEDDDEDDWDDEGDYDFDDLDEDEDEDEWLSDDDEEDEEESPELDVILTDAETHEGLYASVRPKEQGELGFVFSEVRIYDTKLRSQAMNVPFVEGEDPRYEVAEIEYLPLEAKDCRDLAAALEKAAAMLDELNIQTYPVEEPRKRF
jgi:hypothetical protein